MKSSTAELSIDPRRIPSNMPLKLGYEGAAQVVYDSLLDALSLRTVDETMEPVERVTIGAGVANPEIVFNLPGEDVDVRFEGDSDPSLLVVDAGNDAVLIGRAAPAGTEKLSVNGTGLFNGILSVDVEDDSDDGVTHVLSLRHRVTGLAAVGQGVGIRLVGEDDGGGTWESHIRAVATTVTSGLEDSDLVFMPSSGSAVTERMRLDSDGNLKVLGDAAFTIGNSPGERRIHYSNGHFVFLDAGNAYEGIEAEAVFIRDTENTRMTYGVTINQGTADNEILALKSSDVDHGVTGQTETDTYGFMRKASGASGGLTIFGLSEATIGLNLQGLATTDNTDKATTATANVSVNAVTKTGTTQTSPGADANLLAVRANGVARFLFDVEGSGHADVEWTTYDAFDDLALIGEMESELLLREDEAQTERRHMLEEAGVIGRGSWHMENGRPRAMVNFTRLAMLHHGALIQVAERFRDLEARLESAEGRLPLGEPA